MIAFQFSGADSKPEQPQNTITAQYPPQEKSEEDSQLFFHMHLLLFPIPGTPPAASKLASKASEPQKH